MKKRNILVILLVSFITVILNATRVSAMDATTVYNPSNVFLYNIMRFASIMLVIIYIILAIIYCKKSTNKKISKIILLSIYFVITIILAVALYCGSNIIHEKGISRVYMKFYDIQYNQKNVIISEIIRAISIILIIIYIIGAIIFYKKSKKTKEKRIIRLVIGLLIILIISTVLYFGANMVLNIGKKYVENSFMKKFNLH